MTLPGDVTLDGGGPVAGYEYDEYGNLESNATQGFLNETTYTGSVTDKSTGLQYMSARYYDAENGRFLTQDTYTGNPYDPWTQHLYAYCGNNPTSMVDPTGHWFWDISKIVKNIMHTVNKVMNAVMGLPIKPKITSNPSSSQSNRAKQYSKGYKDPGFKKDDTYKNTTDPVKIIASNMGTSKSIITGLSAAAGIVFPESSNAFQHYLHGYGATRQFNAVKAYNEDSNIRGAIDSEIVSQQIAATRIGKGRKDGRYSISALADKDNPYPSNADWKDTIGHYQMSGAAYVYKRGSDYVMLSKITVYDRYNFDKPPFSEIGKMAESGMAFNYDHYGYGYKLTTWTTGG